MKLTLGNRSGLRTLWVTGAALLLVGGAVTVIQHSATSTMQLGSLSIVTQVYASSATSDINQKDAEADAIKAGAQLRPDVSGLIVSRSVHSAGVSAVSASGQTIYSNSAGVDAWVVEITAPAQQGFKKVSGAVVLKGSDGSIMAMSILMTNQ